MGFKDVIEGKREWRAHMRRVKALPPDYQVAYDEMQKYLIKVGPVALPGGGLLEDLVGFLEGGAASGRGVRELIGPDFAAFCDELLGDAPTYLDLYEQGKRGQQGN